MTITTIVFDIGGVILNHAKTISPKLLAKAYDIPLEHASKFYKKNRDDWRTGKIGSYQYLSRMKNQFGSLWSVAEMTQIYREAYMEIAKIDFGMIDIIMKLQSTFTIAALSNTVDIHYHLNKQRGLFDYFHRVYISFNIGYAKPDPRAFAYVLNDLDVSAKNVLFIDDKIENISTAKSLGFTTHHFTSREQLVNDIRTMKLL